MNHCVYKVPCDRVYIESESWGLQHSLNACALADVNDQDITSVFFDVIDFIEVNATLTDRLTVSVLFLNKCWHLGNRNHHDQ